MMADTQPKTHPVLLGIAAAAFLVLLILGINLHSQQSGHVAAGHDTSKTQQNAH